MSKRFIGISLIIVFILIGISASACNKSAVQNDPNQNDDLESLKKDVPIPQDNDLGLTAPVPLPTYNDKKVNRKNFEKIKKGMPELEVAYIFDGLGEPLTIIEDYEQGKEIYQLDATDGKGKIFITFQDGKVSEKEAIDLK